MEETVQRMEALVDDYRQAVNRLNARRRFGDGLFGFGSDPKRAPCHMDFYEGIGEEVARLEGLDARQAGEIAEWLLSLGPRATPCPSFPSWTRSWRPPWPPDTPGAILPEGASPSTPRF